ncbi:MAG: rod shape-determining protein MreC [Clostridia bacterium]|nr:rod shape-determining protein MreC [Clostridia bacterium]
MKRFFSGKGFKVLVTITCVFLVVALVSAGNSSVNNFLTSFLLTPLQRVTSEGVNAADSALAPAKSNEELQQEINRLEKENRDLTAKLVDYYDVKKQNEELQRFYNIKKDNKDFSLLPAIVISRDPNENFYGFTIDKGTLDGVEMYDPVMTENGLVGSVTEVSPKSCKVTTILSPDIKVGALDKRTDDSGIVCGKAANADDGITAMINITEQNTAEKGDIVVTSGYGGVYPKNLRIGKIRQLTLDDYTGMPTALIEPFEDVRNVSSVVVIIDFDSNDDTENSQTTKNN